MADNEPTTETQPAVMWDRKRLADRKAQLEEGLTQLQEQYKAAYQQQRGAILVIEQMLTELDAPPAEEDAKGRAAVRRKARAEKRVKKAIEAPEPVAQGVNGDGPQ